MNLDRIIVSDFAFRPAVIFLAWGRAACSISSFILGEPMAIRSGNSRIPAESSHLLCAWISEVCSAHQFPQPRRHK